MVDDVCVLEVPYNKDAKNKVRSFYKKYYELIKGFFDDLEKKGNSNDMYMSKDQIIQKIKAFQKRWASKCNNYILKIGKHYVWYLLFEIK